VAGAGGIVNPASETLAPATGTALGSIATADSGYDFVNWTKDSGATTVSISATFIPDKVAGLNVAETYTANFMEIPCVYLSYTGNTRSCDPDVKHIYVKVKDITNLNKAVITLRYNRSNVHINGIISGLLMNPCVLTQNDDDGTPYREVTVTITKNSSAEASGDGTIMRICFGDDNGAGSDDSSVSIVDSKLYDKNDNVINHKIDTTPLDLPGLGDWD
jgi:uncharacterized repeat protein (TIGR02543 family)